MLKQQYNIYSDKMTQKTIQHYLIIPDMIFQVEFKQLQNFFVRLKDFTCNNKTSFHAFGQEQKLLRQKITPYRSVCWTNKNKMVFGFNTTHIITYTKNIYLLYDVFYNV